jgi:hypothetical protein
VDSAKSRNYRELDGFQPDFVARFVAKADAD